MGVFPSLYGQRSVTAAWASPSPWSIWSTIYNEKLGQIYNLQKGMYPLIMMCCPQSNSCAQLRQACNLGCNFITCDMWDCSFDKKTAQLSPQSDLAADLANLRQLSGARLTEESPKKWLGQILGRVWTRACKWTSWGRYSWTGWQTSRRIESSSDVAFYILCHLSYYNNSFWLIYSYKGSCFVNFLSSSIFGDGFRYKI